VRRGDYFVTDPHTRAEAGLQSNLQFHILSFEGPDDYSRAGGIATRVTGLAEALAAVGFDTHLWFVGDADLPGLETRGNLTLHRWCQWISRYHRGGVYDGEEGKHPDYVRSLPPFLESHVLHPHLSDPAKRAVVLAEEWQTADAVLHLDWLLRSAGHRSRVNVFWNANNTFGFHRVDWQRLRAAATITTVSRYMRHRMWNLGVDPVVIPNGLSSDDFLPPDRVALSKLRHHLAGRLVLTKVARWDPDKRWLLAVDTTAELKRRGLRPLLIARGGVEAHGAEVMYRAASAGLRVAERSPRGCGDLDLADGLTNVGDVDVVNLRCVLGPDSRRMLFRGSAAVLANSGHEPFGLVGLEAMAAGGLACVGGTGEDYAIPGWNALVLQTLDPGELVHILDRLLRNRLEERAIRRRAQATARRYLWTEVVRRHMLSLLPAGAESAQAW
jgi:glycosyltransferase involved in cell wall biosynthesis